MKLKEGNVLYVRIDYKDGNAEETEQDAMDCMAYLQSVAEERYLAAGIFGDMEQGIANGAMMIFEARDFEEAQKIAAQDPIIARGFYKYKLHQWHVMLAGEGEGQ